MVTLTPTLTKTIAAHAPRVKSRRTLVQIKSTRADKRARTRSALLQAAIDIVGQEGYGAATVARITAQAKVANGTFYNYFHNQQEIFDQLLPFLRETLIAHIKAQVPESSRGLARERARFLAYFDFCRKNPAFLRVYNEAEVFAPAAYRHHIVTVYEGYLHALKRSAARGDIRDYPEEELAPVVFMLMGIRSYMTMLHQHDYLDKTVFSTEALTDIYEKLLSRGLFV